MGRPDPGEIPSALGHDSMKRLLERNGWKAVRGGRHSTKMVKPGCRPITLPVHRRQDYGKGLRAQILRQAGLQPQAGDDE